MVFSHNYPAGTLSVTIFEAKDLKNQDFMGKNDPYIELWLNDDYKQRTSEVSNSNNPVWNETFTFNIGEGTSAHKLYLKVLDKDVVGSDKIGEAKIDFADVYQGSVFDDWVKLPAKLGLSSHGEVRVRIEFAPN
ncbi:C2 domain-containing protein [Syncephalastrum racemosum]|uniref:C2 domain-containing protein n=1 Tax=Syncephalastrum racemosum TaxID=13706 RepID=A0A1X2H1D8_SYNRA|nr:C2 domain-containing protein [Syncephalastrum racemosum]